MSPAIQLLQQVWDHAQKGTSHSWLKLNHAMAEVLGLAIKSGMRFDLYDFETIAKRFRSGYWISADPEWIYRLAVLYRNASAYQAWEKRRGRKPFIYPASISTHTGDGPCGQGLARLIVGAEFEWGGERVKVTSFNDANATLTACSYQYSERVRCPRCERCYSCDSGGKESILHRYTITHADIREAKKARKRSEVRS